MIPKNISNDDNEDMLMGWASPPMIGRFNSRLGEQPTNRFARFPQITFEYKTVGRDHR